MTILNLNPPHCSRNQYTCDVAVKKKNILFLVPYPLKESPSQRFRFEQYFTLLIQNGVEFETQSFLNSHNWQLFYKPGKLFEKTVALMTGFAKRAAILFKIHRYDFVFIHREAAPLGPPIIEWLVGKVFNKKIIYDFDDAIWLTDRRNESLLQGLLKWRKKVASICRWSYKISCGNQYLLDFASKYNLSVILNPTTIDTVHVHNPSLYQTSRSGETVTIGWTGSHSTLKYLEDAADILQRIENKFADIRIIVIADQRPNLNLQSIQFIPWNMESEIQDLMKLDIGIMPLPDDIWTKGKCGFKALQYMALKIPTVASSVGVNTAIIQNGENGFLCSTLTEWETALTNLIKDRKLREKTGEMARTRVVNSYSVLSNSSTFLALFE